MAEKKVVARGRQYGLKHRERLLQQLARGIQEYEKEHPKTPIANLVAEIGEPGSEDGRMFSIGQMLENIANDLYWDDQSNWSEASVLKVGVY